MRYTLVRALRQAKGGWSFSGPKTPELIELKFSTLDYDQRPTRMQIRRPREWGDGGVGNW